MTFSDRLETLLKEKHLTKTALADTLDLRRATISDWKANGNCPKGDIAIKIARFLGVSVDYLLTGVESEQKQIEITPEEMEFIKLLRTVPEEKRQAILMLLN